MQKEELDNLIKQNLKIMIDTPPLVDSEKKWQDFEKRLLAQQKKASKQSPRVSNYQKKFFSLAALAAVFLLILSLSPRAVIGFKNEVFKWLGRTDSGDLVISENYNPQYKLGIYDPINFEEAQDLVIFELKYPHYVPAQFSSAPQIKVVSNDYPKSTATIRYDEGKSFLIIKQENVSLEENCNTYVPQNAGVQKIKVRDNLEVTLIAQDSSYQIFWTENLLKFTLIAKNIAEEEIIKVIEALK